MAPVGGYLEPGEDPLLGAERELFEETGYEAPDWIDLGHFAVGANRGIATVNLYLARNARPVAEPHADDLDEMELLLLELVEVEAALRAGEFKVLAWATAISLALLMTEHLSVH